MSSRRQDLALEIQVLGPGGVAAVFTPGRPTTTMVDLLRDHVAA